MTTAVQIGLATLYLGDALRIIPEWSGVGMPGFEPVTHWAEIPEVPRHAE